MDKIFKIGLLVLGVGYLVYLFCPIVNQVGRYQFHRVTQSQLLVMDTAKADMYYVNMTRMGGENLDYFEKANIIKTIKKKEKKNK
jgi:hypothetical protein